MSYRGTVFSMGLALGLISAPALAQDRAGQFYFGPKAGAMVADVSGMDAAFNGGVTAGYALAGAAVEAEITTSLINGDTSLSGVEWDITTMALYGAFRTYGNIYAKIRAGILREDITPDDGNFSASGDDTGLSYSLGAGYRLPNQDRMEIEYTVVEQDVSFISLGYLF